MDGQVIDGWAYAKIDVFRGTIATQGVRVIPKKGMARRILNEMHNVSKHTFPDAQVRY